MNNLKKMMVPFMIIMIFVLLIIGLYSVVLGTANISPKEVMLTLAQTFLKKDYGIEENFKFIILDLRMPRIILAVLVGGGLSLTGCGLQAIFKNPIADPYITGTSSGALFGASLALVFFKNNNFSLALFSFLGSMGATLLIYNFANKQGRISVTTLLLGGLVLGSLLSALVQIIMIFSSAELVNIFTYTMGSFSGATWKAVAYLSLVFFPIFTYYLIHYKELNIISLGDDNAESMGVNVDLTKRTFLILSALLTSVTVAFVGVIGFVGLIIPHFFRILFGNNHKHLIPLSVLGGSIFMILCDNISRSTLESGEFPVGIVTSIIGAPIFLILLQKSKRLI